MKVLITGVTDFDRIWKNARVRLARIAGMKNAKKELQNV